MSQNPVPANAPGWEYVVAVCRLPLVGETFKVARINGVAASEGEEMSAFLNRMGQSGFELCGCSFIDPDHPGAGGHRLQHSYLILKRRRV